MILGIDIGTSVTKAALIDREGRCVATASQPSKLNRFDDGRVEQDLEEVIESVRLVVRSIALTSAGSIDAVALTAQGDGLWLRDERGQQVRPAISWTDARASAIVDGWRAGGQNSVIQQVYERTGAGIFSGSQASLLAHLAEHEPESLKRAAVAGHCADAVLQRLSGAITVDPSDACMPFLDARTRTYSAESIALCGLTEWTHLLPQPAAALQLFELNSVGAELLGLPVGTPITGGPFDVEACTIGTGAYGLGDGAVVLGTTLSCQSYTDDPSIVPHSEPAGMLLCTPEEELFLRVMPSMVGTASIEWTRGLFGFELDQLDAMLGASAPGARGVRALSFLSQAGERAPFVEPNARGQFIGLNLKTSQADMARAMCESVAFAARHIFDTIGLSGQLSATGGGFKSRQWAQMFADVMGRPLHVPREELVGARGAALVAWQALGHPVDLEQWSAGDTVIEPNDARASVYDGLFAAYHEDLAHARSRW